MEPTRLKLPAPAQRPLSAVSAFQRQMWTRAADLAPKNWPHWLPPLPGSSRQSELLKLATRPNGGRLKQGQALTAKRSRRPGQIQALLADRWYILGLTGSGKSYFAKRLIRNLARLFPVACLYILDSKGGDDFAGFPGLIETPEPPRPLSGRSRIQVWRPPDDDFNAYDAWLGGILKARRPCIILIDELSSLAKGQSGQDYPPNFAKVMKQGRSLGLCCVVLSQEAAYIPRQVKTQATHFVYFGVQDDPHGEAQAMRLLGFNPKEPRRPGALYSFFYRRLNPRAEPAREYRGAQSFF